MLLFIDESGIDEQDSPCVVLGGVTISEQSMWTFEQSSKALQREIFGIELSEVGKEIKGGKLLKKKIFRLAGQCPPIPPDERRALSLSFLTKGFAEKNDGVRRERTSEEFAAYGQSAVEFVNKFIETGAAHGIKVFASIVPKRCPQPSDSSALRKDYSYLLERYFYYLSTSRNEDRGLIICDELDVSQSQKLINQLHKYFQTTTRGQVRSSKIVPIPFFVHSHLTTAIQLADIVCYVINWGVRIPGMNQPTRREVEDFGRRIKEMQFYIERYDEYRGRTFANFGICYIEDLRSAREILV